MVPPGGRNLPHQVQEDRLGEVGPTEERPAVGGQEYRHGPAATTGLGLHRVHVDGVDVGAFLPVDLDVDEQVVHDRRHLGVLEALVRHDVAPVAGGVADRQQDGPVQLLGPAHGVLAPGVPVDGVVPVLAQVGAGLVGQVVHVGQPTGAADREPWPRRVGSVGWTRSRWKHRRTDVDRAAHRGGAPDRRPGTDSPGPPGRPGRRSALGRRPGRRGANSWPRCRSTTTGPDRGRSGGWICAWTARWPW